MTQQLNISDKLRLPLNAVTQTIVVYGGKGMGKTNFGSVFTEELYAAGQRFSVIDPMGVWWGLQHGRQKGKQGLEVLLLGGIHGDLPVEPTGGEVVADLVADESISVVVDISRHANGKAWSKGEKIRFVTTYMTRLYERQVERRRPLMQIIDEAARYAPQKFGSGDVEAAKCLGAIAMLCEEGRNLGIGLTLLTQRSARLNKDVAELADVMIAFRVVGPRSIEAVMDWFGEHVAKERHKGFVEELRKLPIGNALVVSPGWLEFEGAVKIRERQTFDSSATPKSGHALEAPGRATKPDLETYRERMAETIERANENDPKQLKKKIADLQKLLGTKDKIAPVVAKVERVEVPVLKPADFERAEKLIEKMLALSEGLNEQAGQLTKAMTSARDERPRAIPVAGNTRTEPRTKQPEIMKVRVVAIPNKSHDAQKSSASLTRPQQRILDALASLEAIGISDAAKSNVAVFADQSPTSSGFTNNLGTLRTQGLISYPSGGRVSLTNEGRAHAIVSQQITLLDELHKAWFAKLPNPRVRILQALIESYPDDIAKVELAELAGQSATSSGYTNNLGALRSLGLVDYPRSGFVAATKLLFPDGLK